MGIRIKCDNNSITRTHLSHMERMNGPIKKL